MITAAEFWNNVEAKMAERGCDYNKLCERAIVSKTTIYTAKRKESLPTVKTAITLAQALRTSLNELCGYGESSEPVPELCSADVLTKLRKQSKKSQAETAETLGITTIAYSTYERGVYMPSLDKACALAEYFGVSLDYIWH